MVVGLRCDSRKPRYWHPIDLQSTCREAEAHVGFVQRMHKPSLASQLEYHQQTRPVGSITVLPCEKTCCIIIKCQTPHLSRESFQNLRMARVAHKRVMQTVSTYPRYDCHYTPTEPRAIYREDNIDITDRQLWLMSISTAGPTHIPVDMGFENDREELTSGTSLPILKKKSNLNGQVGSKSKGRHIPSDPFVEL